jgi:putative ABC transport system substrate-binding protein
MRRRDFIKGIVGSAATWPLAARAQQSSTVRRVGVLVNYGADEPEGQARVRAFTQGLKKLGWSEGGNLRIDRRWAGGDPALYRRYAAELVQSAPDVILASASASVAALQDVTRKVMICWIFDASSAHITGRSRPYGAAGQAAAVGRVSPWDIIEFQ